MIFSSSKAVGERIVEKISSIVVIVLSFSILCASQSSTADEIFERSLPLAGLEYVPGEIIVKFKDNLSEEAISSLNARYGVSMLYTSPFAGFSRLSIPAGKTVTEIIEIYNEDERVRYAEANYIVHALMIPNDQLYAYQWHLYNADYGGIQMENAWDIATGSDVVIAVIDTGIAYEDYSSNSAVGVFCYKKAPDLIGTNFLDGYDFVDDDEHPNDESVYGHGTHIAGVIAQSTNNTVGTAGVAFNAYLLPVRVLDSIGVGTYANLADAIIWATDSGADVINLGLGGNAPSIILETAVAYAYDRAVTIIAAAGNDGKNTLCWPAAYDDYVIAVGATCYDETLANYSNWGMSLDLVAPGGDLTIDQNKDGYGDGILQQCYQINSCGEASWGYCFAEGTSLAAAQVSAVAALLISANVATTPDEVRQALEVTAEDQGSAGWDQLYGWGIVNAEDALQWTPDIPSPRPVAMFSAEPEAGAEPLTVQFVDQSTGNITAWFWDFGDGQTSTERNPIHTYDSASHYTVTLTVTGLGGTDTMTKSQYINVFIPSPPVADFEAVPTEGQAPLEVQFTDQSECLATFIFREKGTFYITSGDASDIGGITDWIWDFGDGETSNERNPTHIYRYAGTYTVNLEIVGPGGSSSESKEDYIEILVPSTPGAHVNVNVLAHRSWVGYRLMSTVRVLDAYIDDLPIEDAVVEGRWSGDYNGTVSGITDPNGIIRFNTGLIKRQMGVTFTVDCVTKDEQVFELYGELIDSW